MSQLIEAHCYDIHINDNAFNKEGDNQTEIQLWCFEKKKDKPASPALLRVRDFPVFCKVELPTKKNKYGKCIEWDHESSRNVMNDIYKSLDNKDVERPVKWTFTESDKLYYYSGGKKYPFLLLTFLTLKNMREVSRICRNLYTRFYGKIELVFCEMDIDLYNKMFSLRSMGTCDKFTCRGDEIPHDDPDRISKKGIDTRPFTEYQIEWKTLEKVKNEDAWFSYPIIFSFDIETYSHNHRCFPQKNFHEDIIFSISITKQTFMKPETKEDLMIIIGPTNPIKDVVVYTVKDEYEIMEKFFDLVEEHDPDIFIGYNIFGFDYDYMNTRLIDVGKEWRNVGRLQEKGCSMYCKSWNSGAYGFVKMNIFDCPGRISIDMLPYIKRDHKLPMYNLSAVGKHFIGETKVDLKPIEMFEIHQEMATILEKITELVGESSYDNLENLLLEKGHLDELDRLKKATTKNTKIIEYNVQDSLLVLKIFEKLNVWFSLIELSSIVRVTPTAFFTRGQQIRCIAQLYDEASNKNITLTKRENEYIFFNGGKVEDPISGFWPLVLCFDFESLYPSIMIAYNICFTTLLKKPEGVDLKYYNNFNIKQEEPKDAKPPSTDRFDYGEYEENTDENKIVGEKVSKEYNFGFVKKSVKQGLLPQILSKLLTKRKETKTKLKQINKIMDKIDTNIIKKYKQNNDMKVKDIDEESKKIFSNIFPDFKEDDRLSDYHEKLNTEFFSMKVKHIILDSRQLGLKISANSLYGFLGAQVSGKFPLIEGSMCVTSRGRELITESALYFEKNYGAITVYGDTDSTMVHVPSLKDDPTNYWDMAEKMENDINGCPEIKDSDGNIIQKASDGIFPHPLKLAFEKSMRALFMKKKHYAYMSYDKYGNIIKEKNSDRDQLNVKGIVLARRDNCQMIRKTYEKIIRTIFEEGTISEVFTIIIQSIIDVIELKFDIIENLSIVKSMGSNYKSKTFALSIFSELMKSIQRPVQPGERFKYVVVKDHLNRDKLGQKMRTVELFLEQWETSGFEYGDKIPEDFKSDIGLFPPEEIDPIYYITNVLQNPIDKLFEYGFGRIIHKYENFTYTPKYNNRLRPVCVTTPIKMVCQILKDYKDVIKEKGLEFMCDELRQLPGWFERI